MNLSDDASNSCLGTEIVDRQRSNWDRKKKRKKKKGEKRVREGGGQKERDRKKRKINCVEREKKERKN